LLECAMDKSINKKKNLWRSQCWDSYCELWISQFCFKWPCYSAFV